MERIDINELKNYSPELIEEFLAPLAAADERLEIIVPKPVKDAASVDWSVFYIYAFGAYIGEVLFKASASFTYSVPCPTLSDPFIFTVDCRNLPGLVKAISDVVKGYCEQDFDFEHDAYMYYVDAFKDDSTSSSGVWGLLYIATEFFEKANEEDDSLKNEDRVE